MCTYILGAPNDHSCSVECRRNSTKVLAVQVFSAGDLVAVFLSASDRLVLSR